MQEIDELREGESSIVSESVILEDFLCVTMMNIGIPSLIWDGF